MCFLSTLFNGQSGPSLHRHYYHIPDNYQMASKNSCYWFTTIILLSKHNTMPLSTYLSMCVAKGIAIATHLVT